MMEGGGGEEAWGGGRTEVLCPTELHFIYGVTIGKKFPKHGKQSFNIGRHFQEFHEESGTKVKKKENYYQVD